MSMPNPILSRTVATNKRPNSVSSARDFFSCLVDHAATENPGLFAALRDVVRRFSQEAIAWKDFLLATPRKELSQLEFDIESFTHAMDIHLSNAGLICNGLTEEEGHAIQQAIQQAPASTTDLVSHFRENPRGFEAALRGLFHMNCNIFPARITGSATHPFGPQGMTTRSRNARRTPLTNNIKCTTCCRSVDRSLFATHVYVQHGVGAFYELARDRLQQGVLFDTQTHVMCSKMECGQ
ncbi:hypothetical protein CC1G_02652 [Coprinopsis cinerea okayama7|uniref:Uncharacterized protein n=1 Tax=Coprinopsis cinerea (strain Okayama-7 / 130 / ATCC MYA-4618 / FGSC 9003) TaxID=240176 RepID=A8PBI1_COPC7|nr:hypothetical protein CC1G_02652 [Coprinopsis cinerea okayama7\|eukprot:XP_001840189.2 hypothetical protein CC1G_02652 [Coprinopsis cinerea okayama7\